MSEFNFRVISAFLISLFLINLYPLVVFSSVNYNNLSNFTIYSLSIFLLIINLIFFKKNGIRTYTVFPFFYLFALLINTINISSKQLEKEYIDLYFFFVPFIFTVMVFYIFDRKTKSFNFNRFKIIPINYIYMLIILIYILLRLYIGKVVGYRLFSFADQSIMPHGDDFVVPGVSGFAAILQWMILILSPYVKKRYVLIGVLAIILFSVVLHVKRGDLIRIFIFFGIIFVDGLIKNDKLTIKNVFYFFTGLFALVIAFTTFGEYRLAARGGDPGLIVDFLGSRVDSPMIAWLYGYLSFNFEILKSYSNFSTLGICSESISLLNDLFYCGIIPKSNEVVISGFNAGTYLALYARDYGFFLVVPVFILSLFIGLMIYLTRVLNFWGGYVFILTLCILMVFGDYWVNRAIIFSIVFSMILFPFLKINKDSKI